MTRSRGSMGTFCHWRAADENRGKVQREIAENENDKNRKDEEILFMVPAV